MVGCNFQPSWEQGLKRKPYHITAHTLTAGCGSSFFSLLPCTAAPISGAGTRGILGAIPGSAGSAHVPKRPSWAAARGPLPANGVSSWEIAEQSASLVIPSCR